VLLALRTQQIIAHETGIPELVDPLAGSYVVEEFTNRLEKEVLEMIAIIDELGGAVAAIEEGYQEREIARSAYAYQQAVENRDRIIVGLNRFEAEEPQISSLLTIDEGAVKAQLARLKRAKQERKAKEVREALGHLKTAAGNTTNLMPAILESVRVYATLGEISQVLREVFGEYRPS
ncbi:MAG: methylmalonyl-CoA mutase, partial [Fidelibacterota bacterium]